MGPTFAKFDIMRYITRDSITCQTPVCQPFYKGRNGYRKKHINIHHTLHPSFNYLIPIFKWDLPLI